METTIKRVTYNDDNILGIEIVNGDTITLIVNVYLSYESSLNEDKYIDYLVKMNAIVHSSNASYVYIVGDFNANLSSNNRGFTSKYGSYLSNLLKIVI